MNKIILKLDLYKSLIFSMIFIIIINDRTLYSMQGAFLLYIAFGSYHETFAAIRVSTLIGRMQELCILLETTSYLFTNLKKKDSDDAILTLNRYINQFILSWSNSDMKEVKDLNKTVKSVIKTIKKRVKKYKNKEIYIYDNGLLNKYVHKNKKPDTNRPAPGSNSPSTDNLKGN